MEGKYTLETFAEKQGLSRQSALNKLSRLKKKHYVSVSGGGRQKRIYTVSNTPIKKTNGFYDIVNRYAPEPLVPAFQHYVHGNYTIEHAIIDGLKLGDVRTLDATMHLFRHVRDWKRLFELAKKDNLTDKLYALYEKARKETRTRTMPKRYQR